MKTVPRSDPATVFQFLSAVEALEPCPIEQVRAFLKSAWPPVRNAKTFAEAFGLINIEKKKIELSTIAQRLLRYTHSKRIDFVRNYWRLHDSEPFSHVISQLVKNPMSYVEIADTIRVKFYPKVSWSREEKLTVGKAYGDWLRYMNIAKTEGEKLIYIGGEIKSFDVMSLPEIEFLKDRELRDWFIENFHPPNKMLEIPKEILEKVKNENDEQKRGELFKLFVSESFKLLGFIPRTRNFSGNKKQLFKDREGGGDVVLYYHHPLMTSSKTFLGGALACECKSTEKNIGSGAVGQARNIGKKVKEIYNDYLIQSLIISRSTTGYDVSGRKISSPEIVHLTTDTIIRFIETQKGMFSKGKHLILPSHIFHFISNMIRKEILEPRPSDVSEFIKNFVDPLINKN